MPKIIENLRDKLLLEARCQVENAGYSAMTIRSVASGCGVGVGTVYNYFSSKEELIAGFMLEDWKRCIDAIDTVAKGAKDGEEVLRCIYDQLCSFMEQHRNLFQDAGAAASFAGSAGKYHGLLRTQLAKPVEAFCADAFEAEFIAEALLTWTVSGKNFEEIYQIVRKIMEAA